MHHVLTATIVEGFIVGQWGIEADHSKCVKVLQAEEGDRDQICRASLVFPHQ